MAQSKRRRLGGQEMRALLARCAPSGLSVEAFCRQEGISPSSFYRWRSIFSSPSREEVTSGSLSVADGATDFVEVGTLRQAHERLEVRLDLGGGVFLHVVRG